MQIVAWVHPQNVKFHRLNYSKSIIRKILITYLCTYNTQVITKFVRKTGSGMINLMRVNINVFPIVYLRENGTIISFFLIY